MPDSLMPISWGVDLPNVARDSLNFLRQVRVYVTSATSVLSYNQLINHIKIKIIFLNTNLFF